MKRLTIYVVSSFLIFGCVAGNKISPVYNSAPAEKKQHLRVFNPAKYGKTVLKAPGYKQSTIKSEKVTQIREGTILKIVASENGYLKTTSPENITCWVNSNWIEFVDIKSAAIGDIVPKVLKNYEKELVGRAIGYIVPKVSGMTRNKPTINSAILHPFFAGEKLPVLEVKDGWIRIVTKKNEDGWVSIHRIDVDKSSPNILNLLNIKTKSQDQASINSKKPKAEPKIIGYAMCKISGLTRNEPSSESSKLWSVNEGELLPVIEIHDVWFKVITSRGGKAWLNVHRIDFGKSSDEIKKMEGEIKKKLRQARIKSLEAKVKPLPPSDIQGNLNLYKQLLELDPNNKKYKGKVNHYQQKQHEYGMRIAKEKAEKKAYNDRMRANSDIEILSWSWGASSSGNYVTARGLVKNVSGIRLSYVKAVVTYFTGSNEYIIHDSAYTEYNPILNDQESPFEIITRYNPMMEYAKIQFTIDGHTLRVFQKK